MKHTPAAAPLPITPSQTVGPFFRVCLAAGSEQGRLFGNETPRITLTVRVLDGDAAPVDDALLEIWQTGASAELCGFGRLGTDENGRCVFETMRPPGADSGAGHINVCLFARGLLRHLWTRIYFDGDPQLTTDPVLGLVPAERRPTLVARAVPGVPDAWSFDIHLQGEQETVFFDV
jgi:protocatechuate 3,4-dioxygenase alpha subunit